MSTLLQQLQSKPKNLSPERRLQIQRRSTYGNYRRIIGQLKALRKSPLISRNSHLVNRVYSMERSLEILDSMFREQFKFKPKPPEQV